jgi:hypothetical protein
MLFFNERDDDDKPPMCLEEITVLMNILHILIIGDVHHSPKRALLVLTTPLLHDVRLGASTNLLVAAWLEG